MPSKFLQFFPLHLQTTLAVLLLCGCTQAPPTGNQTEASKPVAVKPVVVAQEQVQRSTTQPATVHPYYEADIRARATGYISGIQADIGDFVEAGAELAVIDVPELDKKKQILEAKVVRAESEEKRAQAGVELAKANVQAAEARAAQARSEMSSVQASVAAAEAEFDRTQDLVDRQSLESRVLDEVRKRRDSERARLEAVNSAIRSAEAEVSVARAKASSAEADVAAAQAATEVSQKELEQLEVLIGYSILKAPFSGIVTHRAVDPGDLVRETSEVGQGEPLFVISQVDKVRVRVPLPEIDAAQVNRGDTLSLTFPSFSGDAAIEATVTRTSGSLDPSTRTMIVEADVENAEGKLLPGMFGEATIRFRTQAVANMLPARAIRFSETGEAYVYAIDENESVSVVSITTGLDNGRAIEVTSGVTAGQQVIDAHLQRFSDGQKVRILAN